MTDKSVEQSLVALQEAGVDLEAVLSSVAMVYSNALIANVVGVSKPEERLKFAQDACEGFFTLLAGKDE